MFRCMIASQMRHDKCLTNIYQPFADLYIPLCVINFQKSSKLLTKLTLVSSSQVIGNLNNYNNRMELNNLGYFET